jgi:sec-independent protein translocase protein TatC
VTPNFLQRNRKFAIVIVLSISAIITPPDITSQIIVTIPVLILYEISILISKLIVKKQIEEPK